MDIVGLTSPAAEAAFKRYGLNEITEKRKGFLGKAAKWLVSPISLMFVAALVVTHLAGRTFDFYFILILAVSNFFIGFWQEHKADDAIETLQKYLIAKAKVLRDGSWVWLESKLLVPGDVIELAGGDLVPADAKVLTAANVSVNEAALTGESLPKEKNVGDRIYSGSFVFTGIARAEITATGRKTEFGRTVTLIDRSLKRSVLEKDIISASKMIAVLSLVVIVVLNMVFFWEKFPWSDVALLDLSLLIAGIPISLPTVMAVIIALGVLELAKRQAVVRRLSSLEDLANVDLLLADKTGTLTKNELAIDKVIAYGKRGTRDVVRLASLAVFDAERNQIDKVILDKAAEMKVRRESEIIKFVPADSERKRSSALVKTGGKKIFISLGTPQVIESLCRLSDKEFEAFHRDLKTLADGGYREIALAVNDKAAVEKDMELVGLIALADALRPESREVIDFLKEQGVAVKMVTGDNRLVSERVADRLGLKGGIMTRNDLARVDWSRVGPDWFSQSSVFSEVLPVDKYNLVQAAKRLYEVAATGDGVNDLPALRAADVGIAVSNAVAALKSAADVVLLAQGLAVIKDALIEARKIFARLYVYTVYRISESFRVIITIGVLGLIYGSYPLTAIQLILLALMNDIPIISLAFNRVQAPARPAKVNSGKRLLLSSLFSLSGIGNSLILFFLLMRFTNLDLAAIQTIFFLKLTVSGHMLIYVAHTKKRWWRFLPSRDVIWATSLTQLTASFMAGWGIFMSPIAWPLIIFVWIWSFLWMQISEAMKPLKDRLEPMFKL